MGTTAQKLAAILSSKESIAAAITAKGGSVPTKFSEYGNAVRTLPSGGAPAPYIPMEVDSSGVLRSKQSSFTYAPGCKDIFSNVLRYAFFQSKGLVRLDMSSLEKVSYGYTFDNICSTCQTVAEVDFSSLESISADYAFNYAFYNCNALTSVSFPALKSITGKYVFTYAFASTYRLSSVSFPALQFISGGSAFYYFLSGNSKVTELNFPELVAIGYNGAGANAGTVTGSAHFNRAVWATSKDVTMRFPKLERIYSSGYSASMAVFCDCTKLVRIDLPKLKSVSGDGRNYLFNGCSALKEIHFGAANESAVRSMSGFSTLWGRGAGAATVYFDL